MSAHETALSPTDNTNTNTNTNVSSRPPTPSPENRRDVLRARCFRSRSPGRTPRLPEPVAALPTRRTEERERERHGTSQQHASASAQKRPVIAHQLTPSNLPSKGGNNSPPPPSDDTAPLSSPSALKGKATSRNLPQPLLPDVSLYTNPQLLLENDGTTLEELAHLVRLSKYQERKRANTRIRLQRSLVSTALSARLTRCGEVAQRNLAESFRSEDKKAFAGLFSAIHDVRNSCDATRRYALLEPEMENLQPPGFASPGGLETPTSGLGGNSGPNLVTPFLNDISASAREAFLDFLTQLRTNPDYLATRLCSLSSSELQALTTFHQGLEPIESVLPYYSRPSGRGLASGANRNSAHAPSAVERLLSFQRHDPLSALIYTCFANSAGPDSAEDRRRTDIWANACARIISEAKSNSASEPILTSVLNVWSAMRDWSGRSNMEWYLMKILEDGAFLLDRAEDQNGTRFNISEWTHKDNIAADEFYDRAINDLFEILDDEDATGIPEGVIELGNEILRRLDGRFVDSVRKWFVTKWLFSTWLLAVIIHPESYGMMAEYHITEYGRQKILKQVAQRAQQLVVDMTWNSAKKPVSTPPKVKGHIENILGRFKPSRTQRTARLLPARSITSLRETVEVHPYLVMSPADLLTLVNALFPERRPQSAHSSSIRSGAASISGFSAISQPISVGTSRNNFETASIASLSTSSVTSDATTSREPLLEDEITGTPQRYSPPVHEGASQKRLSNYEDDGYRLRLAMHEMVQILGTDVVSGSCHPCAERWAVLFISADGSSLSLQMTYDPDDDPEEENSSTTSDTEDDDDPNDRPELDKDYHHLRDSILKLVEDFEIPRGLEEDGTNTTFSNRASGLKKYKSKNKILSPESSMGNRNPYRKRDGGNSSPDEAIGPPSRHNTTGKEPQASEAEPSSVLIAMLTAASSQSRVQSDFVSAHLYWKTLQQLSALASPSLRKNGFATLLNIFSRGPKDSIRRSASAIEEYDAWLVWLKQSQERHEGLIETMMKRLRALRDKMWYVTDVHNSAPYEHTRSICSALKIMGVPRRWGNFQRTRAQLSRGPAANYLYKNESQMLDLLAATEEQGGPNKLSDDQAEKTIKWLDQLGIENFCRGEERIHRFCCEVDTCIGKLVGDNIVDGPVLWSSELYLRDRKSLEGTRSTKDRDSLWGGDDASSVISDPERRYPSSSSRPNSIARDLRLMTASNVSQVSLDSRYSFSRASTAMSDILDAQDYFGVASPVHAIDSSTTFWSPFQSTMPSVSSATSRAHSPTTSISNFSSAFSQPYGRPLHSQHSGGRPGTSASSNETVHLQRLSEEKQRFLDELRQTLTSLLLSDLGNYVFSAGSETDSWFDGLGQECIDRRDAQERRSRRPVNKKDRSSKSAAKQRVIEKKKSFGNLRGAGENAAAESTSENSEAMTVQSNDSSATSDTISAHSRPASKDNAPDFPYRKAYQRLLKMFCVHPNPYMKLNALYELEQLINASLTSTSRRSKWSLRKHSISNMDSHTSTSNAKLEQTIDHVKERRSHALHSSTMSDAPSRSAANAETRSIASVSHNTDAVVDLLQSLFKDASMRPKTLFRDLQFIVSFIPQSFLNDRSEKSKALWDAGLAALSLKQEVCQTMIEVADEVIKAHHTQPRKPPAGADDTTDALRPPSPYSLADAARMWTISAKEGDPTAQREFALFNLSYPEFVERTTLPPLSKPREVFKQALMEKYGARSGNSTRHPVERMRAGLGGSAPLGGSSEGAKDGDVRNDPALMCVAFHWMGLAEQGNDKVARTFLSQNEIMGLG